MKNRFCAAVLVCVSVLACAQTNGKSTASESEGAKLQGQIRGGRAKNIILFIGDGMGDSEITAARNYQVGASGRLALDTLPFTGSVTTYSLQESDPSKPDYVTDSAAGGTAWATGQKTSNRRISTSAKTDRLERQPFPGSRPLSSPVHEYRGSPFLGPSGLTLVT